MSPFRHFIETHWGDLIALHLIYLGIAIVYFAKGNSDYSHIGESLILSGGMTLRFKGQDKTSVAPLGS